MRQGRRIELGIHPQRRRSVSKYKTVGPQVWVSPGHSCSSSRLNKAAPLGGWPRLPEEPLPLGTGPLDRESSSSFVSISRSTSFQLDLENGVACVSTPARTAVSCRRRNAEVILGKETLSTGRG